MVKHIEVIDVGSENNEAPKEVEEIKEEPIINEKSKEVETNIIINEEENKVEEEEPKQELKSKKTELKKWSVQSVKIFNKIHFQVSS